MVRAGQQRPPFTANESVRNVSAFSDRSLTSEEKLSDELKRNISTEGKVKRDSHTQVSTVNIHESPALVSHGVRRERQRREIKKGNRKK